MTFIDKFKVVFITELRFLCFRSVRPDLDKLGNYYLGLGLMSAWLAGIGRYWDNPRAELWQYLGLGSLVYIFILAFIIWALLKPLGPENWSYRAVLIFVGMTSLPAILYALPVERFFSLDVAQTLNVWFLGVVALWRIVLLFLYIIRSARIKGFAVVVAVLLPLVIIVTVLAALNLEHVVFSIMAGIAEEEKTANDAAYFILLVITYFSVLASPVLLIAYLVLILNRRKASAHADVYHGCPKGTARYF